MATFNRGDTVRIQGRGGDVMTIEKIDNLHGVELAHCRWFDAKTNKQREGIFPSATLEFVPSSHESALPVPPTRERLRVDLRRLEWTRELSEETLTATRARLSGSSFSPEKWSLKSN